MASARSMSDHTNALAVLVGHVGPRACAQTGTQDSAMTVPTSQRVAREAYPNGHQCAACVNPLRLDAHEHIPGRTRTCASPLPVSRPTVPIRLCVFRR